MQPLTVLMPARDASSTLGATLVSLRAQTLPAFAVRIINDGGDASIRDIAHQAWREAGALRPLEVVDLPPVGLVAALQHGLATCSTAWVARMDADDLAHPERLAKQWAAVQATSAQVIGCGVESFSDTPLGEGFRLYDQWQNQLLTHEDILRERFIESPLVHPTVLYHRETVLAAGGYRQAPWAEDYDLWLRLAAHGARFHKLPEVLLWWRDHLGRATRQDTRYRSDALLRCKAHHLARGPLSSSPAAVWGAGTVGRRLAHGSLSSIPVAVWGAATVGRRLAHGPPSSIPVAVWGAGTVGRRLARYLYAEGCAPQAFIDVDPRKVGGVRRGHVPVLGVEALPTLRHLPVIAAVGSRGARPLIRQALQAAGWEEGVNFWCAA